jgi:hypothetical protein
LSGHDIPSAIPSPELTGGGYDLPLGLKVQGLAVLTRRPLPVTSLPDDRPANSH